MKQGTKQSWSMVLYFLGMFCAGALIGTAVGKITRRIGMYYLWSNLVTQLVTLVAALAVDLALLPLQQKLAKRLFPCLFEPILISFAPPGAPAALFYDGRRR